MASLPRPLVRRPLTITLASALALLLAAASIVVVPLLYLVDVVSGSTAGRRTRAWLLITTTLWTEAVGVVAASVLALWYLNGRRAPERWVLANYRLEHWWCRRHYKNLHRFAGVTVTMPDPSPLDGGPSIMVARHSSHIDAIVPLLVLAEHGRFARYTLKEDLKWAPAMDLVGDRTPNVWINRSTPGSTMFEQVEQLAAEMSDTGTCVIFPEGTFRTQERHERAIERLRGSREDLADKASGLRYVLPPRPAGTLALMRGAPDADLVVLANVGVEGRSSIREIIDTITERRDIEVHAVRFPRAEIPTDEDLINSWLIERWVEMDDWIHHRVIQREADRTETNG
ncbi:MAG: 1-acyl-sn-glycerol-3-phosphate acyltransferase [Acidimicrobiales bacterium]|nr:1-acyl-sn-glycerol-3-phosphate acyltransferase [Acidimicrobiales bacterium]